jgi:hypothetical protein
VAAVVLVVVVSAMVSLLALDTTTLSLRSDPTSDGLDYLLKLAAVEPNALAVRADVGFNTVLINRSKLRVTYWAVHSMPPWCISGSLGSTGHSELALNSTAPQAGCAEDHRFSV